MIRRVFLQCVCIMLLLVAQHGALTHAVWHAHEQLPVSAHHDHDGVAGGEPSSESDLCDFDLAFGQAMGGVHTACWHFTASEPDAERIAPLPHSRTGATVPAARSRGPPVPLS